MTSIQFRQSSETVDFISLSIWYWQKLGINQTRHPVFSWLRCIQCHVKSWTLDASKFSCKMFFFPGAYWYGWVKRKFLMLQNLCWRVNWSFWRAPIETGGIGTSMGAPVQWLVGSVGWSLDLLQLARLFSFEHLTGGNRRFWWAKPRKAAMMLAEKIQYWLLNTVHENYETKNICSVQDW